MIISYETFILKVRDITSNELWMSKYALSVPFIVKLKNNEVIYNFIKLYLSNLKNA